jgi:amidase
MTEESIAPPPADVMPNPGRLDGYRGKQPLYHPQTLTTSPGVNKGRQLIRSSMKAILTLYNLDAIIYPTQTTRINRIGEYAKRNQRGLFGNFGMSLASLAAWPELTVPLGLT